MRGRINAKLLILMLTDPTSCRIAPAWIVTRGQRNVLAGAASALCKFMEDVDIENAVRSIICLSFFLSFFIYSGEDIQILCFRKGFI